MLFDTPIPTFPLDEGKGLTGARELSPIQAVPHFKDFAPLDTQLRGRGLARLVTIRRWGRG